MSVVVSSERRPPRMPAGVASAGPPRRRVRQDARDALAVAAFTASASTALAVVILLIVTFAG